MKRILPQANTFDTVIRVFMFAGIKTNYTKQDIADFCQFELRQADYYLGTCIYYGLFDNRGKLTALGDDILNKDSIHCKERLYELVIGDELSGKIFAHILLNPNKDIKDIKRFAADITRERYDNYSDAVIERRSSCIVGWCCEILDYLHIKHS